MMSATISEEEERRDKRSRTGFKKCLEMTHENNTHDCLTDFINHTCILQWYQRFVCVSMCVFTTCLRMCNSPDRAGNSECCSHQAWKCLIKEASQKPLSHQSDEGDNPGIVFTGRYSSSHFLSVRHYATNVVTATFHPQRQTKRGLMCCKRAQTEAIVCQKHLVSIVNLEVTRSRHSQPFLSLFKNMFSFAHSDQSFPNEAGWVGTAAAHTMYLHKIHNKTITLGLMWLSWEWQPPRLTGSSKPKPAVVIYVYDHCKSS